MSAAVRHAKLRVLCRACGALGRRKALVCLLGLSGFTGTQKARKVRPPQKAISTGTAGASRESNKYGVGFRLRR